MAEIFGKAYSILCPNLHLVIALVLCHPLLEKTRRHKSTRPPLSPSRSSSHATSTVVSTVALPGVLGIVLEGASFTAVDTALLMASLMLWLAILLTSRSCGCYKVTLGHPVYHVRIILLAGGPHVTFANDMNHKNYMIYTQYYQWQPYFSDDGLLQHWLYYHRWLLCLLCLCSPFVWWD